MPNTFKDVTSTGITEVVAAQTGNKRIRVLSVHLMTDTDVSARFLSAATAISAQMPLPGRGGFVIPASGTPGGWFQTNPGEALNIELSGAANVGVNLSWVPA